MRGDHLGVSANPALVRFLSFQGVHVLEVPEGESAKTFETLEWVCEQLASLNVSRADVVVGVGGGAITDLADCAAVYLRGVRLIQVPTTLVGQVDASIGEDCVNLEAGKNSWCLPPARDGSV